MKTQTDELYAEATRSLEGYLKSGLAGMYQQGIDRLAAVGIKTDAFRDASKGNARYLLGHLTGR